MPLFVRNKRVRLPRARHARRVGQRRKTSPFWSIDMKKLIAIAALSLLAAPAAACDFRELPWQTHAATVAIVGDVISTKYCLDRKKCDEGNSLYGKHPSDAKLFGGGVARIALNTGI